MQGTITMVRDSCRLRPKPLFGQTRSLGCCGTTSSRLGIMRCISIAPRGGSTTTRRAGEPWTIQLHHSGICRCGRGSVERPDREGGTSRRTRTSQCRIIRDERGSSLLETCIASSRLPSERSHQASPYVSLTRALQRSERHCVRCPVRLSVRCLLSIRRRAELTLPM
jgi:hypothetical protein